MKKQEYEDYVDARCKGYVDENYCVIAINEEAGEIAGWYKKYVLRGNPTEKYTREDLRSELGDVLFYLTALAHANGWSLSDVMETNKAKLDDREEKKKASDKSDARRQVV